MFENFWGIASLVIQEFLFPTLGYCFLFFSLTFAIGSAGFFRAKKRFPSTASKKWLILIGALYFLIFPVVSTQLGFLFSLQRFMGKMLERGAPPIIEWTLQLGVSHAQGWMGDLTNENVLQVGEVRKKIQLKIQDGSIPAARIGHPIILILFFPQILEALFWHGTDLVLASLEKETASVTWGVLLHKSKEWLSKEGQKFFQDQANSFYFASYLYVFGVLLWAGLLQGIIYFLIKKIESKKTPTP